MFGKKENIEKRVKRLETEINTLDVEIQTILGLFKKNYNKNKKIEKDADYIKQQLLMLHKAVDELTNFFITNKRKKQETPRYIG